MWTDKHLGSLVQHTSDEAEVAITGNHYVAVAQHEKVNIELYI
jgi:hypothetical protein